MINHRPYYLAIKQAFDKYKTLPTFEALKKER
ncbi:MAG: hypothetical protein RIQ89_893 [Bacteroidota bacterium]|jgi:hypothetical protein